MATYSRTLAVILALALVARDLPAREEAVERKAQPFVIVGTVDMPDDAGLTSALPVVPVELDPRFVIRVRIDEVLRGTPPWKVGSTLRFLIHSPARMFGRSNVRNERFCFTFAMKPGPAPDRGCKYCVTAVEEDHPNKGSSGRPTKRSS